MVDGIKIVKLVPDEVARQIMAIDSLDFYQKTSISTGEIGGGGSVEAKYNGLTFRLNPNTNSSGGFWLVIRGSLHRFYNDGGTNGNDFFQWQFKEAIMKIETLLNLSLSDFKIENFEIAVNLETELTSSKYINALVYDGNKAFANLNINDIYVGKQCTRQDTTFKVYDKGKQDKSGHRRLLRVELKFNRMRLLVDPQGRFKIYSLLDLMNPEKVGILGQELAARWGQVIFYDGAIDKKTLTPDELTRLWQYRSPQFWQECNRGQRYKARLKFNKLMKEKATRQTHKQIEKMILSKWAELVNMKHKAGRRLTHFENEIEAHEAATFDTVQCTRLLSPNDPKKEKGNFQKKSDVAPRFCPMCGKDISTRKKTAVTCCRKCRNAKSNQARKEKNTQKREREKVLLNVVLEKIKTSPVKITVWCIGQKRGKAYYTNKIKPMKYKERRKITRVCGSCGQVPFEFTTMRAKEFVKYCFTNT